MPLTKLNGGAYAIHSSNMFYGFISKLIKISSSIFNSTAGAPNGLPTWRIIIKDVNGYVMSIDNTKTIIKDAGSSFLAQETNEGDITITIDNDTPYTVEVYYVET